MLKEAFLSIDFGTSNVHAYLVDAYSADVLSGTKKKYNWYSPTKSEIELHADEVWDASEQAVGEIIKNIQKDIHIAGITFSFFGDSITPVDQNGKALYAMIPGFCGRSFKEIELIDKEIGADKYASITGNTLTTMSSVSKILWIRENHPDVFQNTACFYSNQQYILHRLGIPGVQDRTLAARKLAYDIKGDHWSWPLLDLMGISEKKLGDNIVESATVVGKIGRYGNVILPYEVPITIGCHDVSASLLAAGVQENATDTMGVLMGTYEQIGYFSDTFVDGCNDFQDSLLFSFCYNSPFKGRYSTCVAFPTAGALLEWYCHKLLKDKDADIGKLISNAKLDGNNPLIFLPYVENYHGGIFGMSLGTSEEDIFEALLESLAFQFAECIKYIKSTRKEEFKNIHFGGGGSRADKLLQLRSDLIGAPIGRMSNVELPSVGACMLAGIGNGMFKDVEDAAHAMVHGVQYFAPDTKQKEKYQEKYNKYKAISSQYLRNF